MKFGLFGGANSKRGGANADTTDYRRVIDMIREADDLGFHSIFMVEHHFTGIGQVSATLSMLAYLAAVTKRIRLGTGVTVLPWHNPVLVAEQAATVDLLSNGRLDFGVGRGYRDLEFHGFAMDKSEAEGRYRESIDLILRAFTSDERFSHAGKYWKFDDIIVEPPTIQKPHPPVWTAAGSDDSIRRVARDGWNVMFDQFANIARTQERLEIWRDECKALGRTYDPMQVCVARGLTIVKSDEEYRKALEARHLRTVNFIKEFGNLPGQTGAKPAGVQLQPQSYSDNLFEDETGALIGKPDQVIRQIEVLRDMGFEYILLLMPNDPEILRIFAREIMPHFARESAAVK